MDTWNNDTRYYTIVMHYDSRYTLNCIYILTSVSSIFPCFQLGSRFLGFYTDTFGFELAASSTSILWNSCITASTYTEIIISSSAIPLTGTLVEC